MYTINKNLTVSVDYDSLELPSTIKNLEEWRLIESRCSDIVGTWTDKDLEHEYYHLYWKILKEDKSIEVKNVLEIGIRYGYSLCTWNVWFNSPKITGIDICLPQNLEHRTHSVSRSTKQSIGIAWGYISMRPPYVANFPKNIKLIEADIMDYTGLDDERYDFIIDDASHKPEHQLYVLNRFYKNLNTGGVLIIEDIKDQETLDFLAKNFIGDKRKLIKAYHDPEIEYISKDSNILIYKEDQQ